MAKYIGLRSAETAEGDEYVQRLILAIQQAVADVTTASNLPPSVSQSNAFYMLDALLCTVASIAEQDPACLTPSGMRKVSEQHGRSLLHLMKAARSARELVDGHSGSIN